MDQPSPLTEFDPADEIVAFTASEQEHEDYRFAATNQISVLVMGLISATLLVLMVAGLETVLHHAIAWGWIEAPPTSKFYAELINQP